MLIRDLIKGPVVYTKIFVSCFGESKFDMYCRIVLKVGFAFEEHAIKLPITANVCYYVWLHQNTCNFTATKFKFLTAFLYLQRGQVQLVQLGQVQFEQQFHFL